MNIQEVLLDLLGALRTWEYTDDNVAADLEASREVAVAFAKLKQLKAIKE